jgi:hypothetical protein
MNQQAIFCFDVYLHSMYIDVLKLRYKYEVYLVKSMYQEETA